MYMIVERNLHIKVIDSLNFLPIEVSELPKAFWIKGVEEGLVPPLF